VRPARPEAQPFFSEGLSDAMNCLVPDGGSFIRAYDAGVFRSLTNREFIDFLEALQEMPWSGRNKIQGGELTVPLTAIRFT
jgi:hypothetical protein